MKECPRCGRTFGDEYSFCLEDGIVLTLVQNEDKTTVFARDRAAGPEPAEPPLPTIAAYRPIGIGVDDPADEPRRLWPWLAAIVAVLVILGGSVLTAVVVFPNRFGHLNAQTNAEPKPTVTPVPSPTVTPTISPSPTAAKPTPSVSPTPAADSNSAPTKEAPKMDLVGTYVLFEFWDKTQSPRGTLEVTAQTQFGVSMQDDSRGWAGFAELHWKGTRYEGTLHWTFPEDDRSGESDIAVYRNGMLAGQMPDEKWIFVALKSSDTPGN